MTVFEKILQMSVAVLCLLALVPEAAVGSSPEDPLVFDDFTHEFKTTLPPQQEFYEADIADFHGKQVMTWLEHVPGQGSQVWFAEIDGGKITARRRISTSLSWHANPRLVAGGRDRLWLTYEYKNRQTQDWDLAISLLDGKGNPAAKRVLVLPGNDINHRIAAAPNGDLWVAWMADNHGQWDIYAVQFSPLAKGIFASPVKKISSSLRGDWFPDICVQDNGKVCIVWDTYTGRSYDVVCRWLSGDQLSAVYSVASGPEFQGYPRVATDGIERTYVLWEEGAVNWGGRYGGNAKDWNNVRDDYGPLHRFRRLDMMGITEDGQGRRLKRAIPHPSFQSGQAQELRSGVSKLGRYYEKGRVSVDPSGRVWIAYKHYVHAQCGTKEPTRHHVYEGFGVYARFLDAQGWSPAYSTPHRQGGGAQSLDVLAHQEGASFVWTIGLSGDHRSYPGHRSGQQ